MSSSHQPFVKIFEDKLALTDSNDPNNRKAIYDQARKALAGVRNQTGLAGDPGALEHNQLSLLEQLEIAITEVESRYAPNAFATNFSSHQRLEPAPANGIFEIDPPNSSADEPVKSGIWGILKTRKIDIAFTTIMIVGAVCFAYLSGYLRFPTPPLPDMFTGQSASLALPVYGEGKKIQLSAYGELSVVNNPSSEQTSTVILTRASTAGETEISKFAFTPLDPAYIKKANGNKIRIGIIARATEKNGEAPSFATRFHSSQIPLEAKFQQLTNKFATYFFDQEIPKANGKENSEMIIVIPRNSPRDSEIEIRSIKILIL